MRYKQLDNRHLGLLPEEVKLIKDELHSRLTNPYTLNL